MWSLYIKGREGFKGAGTRGVLNYGGGVILGRKKMKRRLRAIMRVASRERVSEITWAPSNLGMWQ